MIERRLIHCLKALVLVLLLANGRPASVFAAVAADKYTLVYSDTSEPGRGRLQAEEMARKLLAATGKAPKVCADTVPVKGSVVRFKWNEGLSPFAYRITPSRKSTTIEAGGEWAMDHAASALSQWIAAGKSLTSYRADRSLEGLVLFPRRDDANLRILVDNIWDYSAETLPKAWEEAGIDCRDKHRAPQFAQLTRAYMPDVLALQEYNIHMHREFYPLIQAYGYEIAYDSGDGPWNNTPIFYQKDSMELKEVNYHLFTPEQWCNAGTKSFASAVFRHKKNGRLFALINAHLWWKSDKAQPGSTMARAAQIRLIMAEAEIIRQKHDCPIFVVGDMNSEEPSVPIQQFIQEGYVPCYKVATVSTNHDNGHHVCGPTEVGRRESRRKSGTREVGAIDHCLLYNAKTGDEVKVFDCLQPYFTVLITDHYPNLIDANLNAR